MATGTVKWFSDDAAQSTVDLAAHRGESGLDDLDLGDDEQPAAA